MLTVSYEVLEYPCPWSLFVDLHLESQCKTIVWLFCLAVFYLVQDLSTAIKKNIANTLHSAVFYQSRLLYKMMKEQHLHSIIHRVLSLPYPCKKIINFLHFILFIHLPYIFHVSYILLHLNKHRIFNKKLYKLF